MNNFGQMNNTIPFNGMNMNNNNFSPMNGNNNNSNFFSGLNVNNLPRYDITRVRGQSGAEAFQMGPNSRFLLLDENDPIVWLVQTDGAGYKNVAPYSITPYQAPQPIDIYALENRITMLEEKINAKSYNGTNKQSRKQQQQRNEQPNEFVETANSAS